MAVGNTQLPQMHPVKGIKLGCCNAGIKQTERDDVLLMQMDEGGSCAAVFTQNAFCAAPVTVAKSHLLQMPRWLLVNSGNANAGTGRQGMDDALASCAAVAEHCSAGQQQVMPFSTGVIGENLPMDKLLSAIPKAADNLDEAHWLQAATAIMTTDTFPKGVSRVFEIDGQPVTITGISKGAGMIQPNMATMLGFIATDAKISQSLLQTCLSAAVDKSFNRITVDSDTSTNDACVILASACSNAPEITENSTALSRFSKELAEVCFLLAEAIVRDGEGATKLITIKVEQAADSQEALQVAKTVAHSPLVKTAFFASDPNWGRILAAVGRSGIEQLAIEKLRIYLDEVCIVENGGRADSYTEAAGQAVMDQQSICIRIDLARGDCAEQVLTCDFSYDYVRINAEYRT